MNSQVQTNSGSRSSCLPNGSPAAAKARRAATLVELLVTISVIGVLTSILLPAVQAARQAAREAMDANSIKQLVLATQFFHDSFGHFPGPHTGNAGLHEGWSFAVLPFAEGENLLNAFDATQPLDYAVNMKVAAEQRPVIFGSQALVDDDDPYVISATDNPSAVFNILPSANAFNGFLLNKRFADIPSSHRTALYLRTGACGWWNCSPEFYSYPSGDPGRAVLIGFLDGSVQLCMDGEGVVVEP